MPSYSFVLYDSALFMSTAAGDIVLYQVAEGGDSTHVKPYTNMRGAGQLPASESLLVKKLGVWLDANVVAADAQDMWIGSYIEIEVANRTVLEIPLALCAMSNGFGGVIAQTSAADEAIIGKLGDGFTLDIPILINGGTNFKVIVHQETAVAADSTNVKVALLGDLSIP